MTPEFPSRQHFHGHKHKVIKVKKLNHAKALHLTIDNKHKEKKFMANYFSTINTKFHMAHIV